MYDNKKVKANLRTINFISSKLGEDLKNEIKSNSKIKIASSIFSMYGYNHLKKELNNL